VRDRALLARRVVTASPDALWSALTDPWTFVTLLGGCTVLAVDDAPWRLGRGSVVEATVRRRNLSLSATTTVVEARPGERIAWRVDLRRGGRTVHAGRFGTVELRPHPVGCVVTALVERTPASGVVPGALRERGDARARTDLAVRLRDLDLLVTGHDAI